MSKNDLQFMINHVNQLKCRLANSTESITAQSSILFDKSVGTDDFVDLDSTEMQNVAIIEDGFDPSDGENERMVEDIQQQALDASVILPICSSDDNGNDIPKPITSTSTPKIESNRGKSQKALTRLHRQSMMEETRQLRKSQLENSKMSWKSMLASDDEDDNELQAMLHLQISFTTTDKSGGI